MLFSISMAYHPIKALEITENSFRNYQCYDYMISQKKFPIALSTNFNAVQYIYGLPSNQSTGNNRKFKNFQRFDCMISQKLAIVLSTNCMLGPFSCITHHMIRFTIFSLNIGTSSLLTSLTLQIQKVHFTAY